MIRSRMQVEPDVSVASMLSNDLKIRRPPFSYQQQLLILIFNHPFVHKSSK